jgi:hypothetical protein
MPYPPVSYLSSDREPTAKDRHPALLDFTSCAFSSPVEPILSVHTISIPVLGQTSFISTFSAELIYCFLRQINVEDFASEAF